MKKVLGFWVYSPRGNSVWLDNLWMLKRFWCFDAAVFGVPEDASTEHYPVVQSFLRQQFGRCVETIRFENHPKLREDIGHPTLITRIREISGEQMCFYGHTKGTAPRGHWGRTQQWKNSMYWANFSQVPLVERLLGQGHWACAGSHQMTSPFSGWRGRGISPTPRPKWGWHYAGSFYWMGPLFWTMEWNAFLSGGYGCEAYPGNVCPRDQAYSLAFHNPEASVAHIPGAAIPNDPRVVEVERAWKIHQIRYGV